MALYEAAQDVKLGFGFGTKRRKKMTNNSVGTKFSAKKKLKLVLDI